MISWIRQRRRECKFLRTGESGSGDTDDTGKSDFVAKRTSVGQLVAKKLEFCFVIRGRANIDYDREPLTDEDCEDGDNTTSSRRSSVHSDRDEESINNEEEDIASSQSCRRSSLVLSGKDCINDRDNTATGSRSSSVLSNEENNDVLHPAKRLRSVLNVHVADNDSSYSFQEENYIPADDQASSTTTASSASSTEIQSVDHNQSHDSSSSTDSDHESSEWKHPTL
ncbi:hypothetical protein OS493_011994 [Desmophyllum pertusum]|uniref:Uncharacterized protein n=1 Tax=Desmophyllum pertusum TaxID=174260 RepID=A0A9X0DA99_9CNID|nr:hypothetical protein OS493_011994 [Desmophyllum pertusum]